MFCHRRQTESSSSLAYYGDGGGPIVTVMFPPVSIIPLSHRYNSRDIAVEHARNFAQLYLLGTLCDAVATVMTINVFEGFVTRVA